MDGLQRFGIPDTSPTFRTGSSTTPHKKPFTAYCVTSNPKSCHRRDRNRTGESTAHPHSERLSAEDAMPYRLSALLMPGAEKIKEIATLLPHIAVPAGATHPFGLIDSERRVTILPIGVMFPKCTT